MNPIKALSKRYKSWYQEGVSFRCTQCGSCCTGPSGEVGISTEEIEDIASSLNLKLDDFLDLYTRISTGSRQRVLIKKGKIHTSGKNPDPLAYDCIFLTKKDSFGHRYCQIHEVKPAQCLAWPFWPEIMKSQKAWNEAGKYCPGINLGNIKTSNSEIKKHLKVMKKLEKSRGSISAGWRD